jgi:hypothetical protein
VFVPNVLPVVFKLPVKSWFVIAGPLALDVAGRHGTRRLAHDADDNFNVSKDLEGDPERIAVPEGELCCPQSAVIFSVVCNLTT